MNMDNPTLYLYRVKVIHKKEGVVRDLILIRSPITSRESLIDDVKKNYSEYIDWNHYSFEIDYRGATNNIWNCDDMLGYLLGKDIESRIDHRWELR